MALLKMEGVCCAYGATRALEGFSLQVAQGEIAALLGPSGCGKTTALRAIAGFEPVLRGEIRIAGQLVSRPGFTLPPERRGVGMMFQDRALFPHMTVAQNIATGIRHQPRGEQDRIIGELLALIGLADCAKRYPHELSGGQQERVALARALAPRPHLLLLDEPFASLDFDLRERLGVEVRNILKETGATAVLVTHQQAEAFAMGDQVGVVQDGRILQWDTPFNVYHRPRSRRIATLVGRGQFIVGTLRADGGFDTEFGRFRDPQTHDFGQPPETRMDIMVHPNDVLLDPDGPVLATVVEKAFKGDDTLYTFGLASGTRVMALTSSHNDLAIGVKSRLRLDLEHLVAYPRTADDPGSG